MNIVLIPARGGSKGLPKKNVKLLAGKPLIAWSIEQALSAVCVDQVFVSTDCSEIQRIAQEFGASVPFLRPQHISGDTASTEAAVMHFINWADDNRINVVNLILMQATSPFRYKNRIDAAMRHFRNQNADSLLTVCKTHRFVWKNPCEPSASYEILHRPRRQDIAEEDAIYFENGSFYISKISTYKQYENRLGGKIAMFDMSPEESFEIDDQLDFDLIEFLMKRHGLTN